MKKIIKGKADLIQFLNELKEGKIETFSLYNEAGARYIFDFSANIARVSTEDDKAEQANPYFIPEVVPTASSELATESMWVKNEHTESTPSEEILPETDNEQVTENSSEQQIVEDSREQELSQEVEEIAKENVNESEESPTQEQQEIQDAIDEGLVLTSSTLLENKEEVVEQLDEYVEEGENEFPDDSSAEQEQTLQLIKSVESYKLQLEELEKKVEVLEQQKEEAEQSIESATKQLQVMAQKLEDVAVGNQSTEKLVNELRSRGYIVTLQA